MRAKIIHVTLRRSGNKARREEVLESGRLTVGRGTDNDLHITGLTVSLRHAAFAEKPDGIYVESVDATDLRVNGTVVASRKVRPGDIVRVGQHEVRVLEPSGDAPLVLEVEQVESSSSEMESLRSRTAMGIEKGVFARRPLAYGAMAFIFLLFLALPLAGRMVSQSSPGAGPGPLAGLVHASWLSGPLATPHGNLDTMCETCHRTAFQKVANEACRDCHPTIGRHTMPTHPVGAVDGMRCADCHMEHNGDAGLKTAGEGSCESCHGNLHETDPNTRFLDVASFAEHPEFRPSVVVDPSTMARERILLTDLAMTGAPVEGQPRERSGLIFPHDVHLEEGLRAGDGGRVQLVCADCHVPDFSRELMAPVRYEEHCSSCHPLTFDAKDPERAAPHGKPAQVARAVFEFYASEAIRGDVADPVAPETPKMRRRPGRMAPMEDVPQVETRNALAWARKQAATANKSILSPRGTCAICHVVIEDEGGEKTVAPVRVLPVRGAERWMPFGRFDHEPHKIADCETCHDAKRSTDAGTVLMPDVASCGDCHGDSGAVGEVSSPCVSCHDFHVDEHGPFGVDLPLRTASLAGNEGR